MDTDNTRGIVLVRSADSKRSAMILFAREFSSTHVHSVFAQHGLAFETHEFLQSSEAVVIYNISVDPRISFKDVSAHLLNGQAGIKSVAWQASEKEGGSHGL